MCSRTCSKLPLLVLAVVAACGGGDGVSGGDSGVLGGSDGGTATGGAGQGGSAGGIQVGSCRLPAGATVVMQPTVLSESPIYRMQVDGGRVYFTSVDQLLSVSTAGGAHTVLYPPAGSNETLITPPFFVRTSDIVLLKSRDIIFLPKTGGMPTGTRTLPNGYGWAIDGRADVLLDPDGIHLNYKTDSRQGDQLGSSYFRFNLATGAATNLAANAPFGYTRSITQAGGFIYTTSNGGSTESQATSRLYRVPLAGGAPEEVSLLGSFRFSVVAANATHLYIAGFPVPLDSVADPGGLYRVVLAGGMPEHVVQQSVAFNISVGVVSFPGYDILYVVDSYYKLPTGARAPTRLYTVESTGNCTVHAFTAESGFIYGSLYDSVAKAAIIYKVAVP